MAETVTVTGLRELADALRELPLRVARSSLRGAVSSAAALVRDKAREIAPKLTGEMARDIQIKRARTSGNELLRARYDVFVRAGKKSRLSGKARGVDKDSYYWRFVEFGTSKMAARPFMRPAFETTKSAAVEQIKEYLKDRIPAEVAALPGAR